MPSSDTRIRALARNLHKEGGQVLPLTALMMVVLIGFAALVVDVGRVYLAQRQLQNAVDATALAVAQNMTSNDYGGYSTYPSYDGVAPSKNALFGYGVTATTPPTITFLCSPDAPGYNNGQCPADTSPQVIQDGATPCDPGNVPNPPTNGCNAVNVSESASVKSTFAGIFGFGSFNLTANATASAPQTGKARTPLNVEIILDTTNSMQQGCSSSVTGINNNPDKLDCAKAGVQTLLSLLSPCIDGAVCGPTTPNPSPELGANVSPATVFDEVGLMAFPALSNVASRPNEVDCKNQNFAVTYPTYPPNGPQPGYDIIGLSSDYRTSDAATSLNTSSDLVKAVWFGASCLPSGNYPGPGDIYGLQDIGGEGSYLAGAIAEAQTLLAAAARPNVQNAIIVLSDGILNQPHPFTDKQPCNSANTAATNVKTDTLIFSIAYNTDPKNPDDDCTDTAGPFQNVPGLTLMQDIATPNTAQAKYFYDQPDAGDLTQVFNQIGTALGNVNSRLIPNP